MTAGLLFGIYVFVLAMFVGFEIITKVPPTLHTPLMSGANAVSGITIVGALLAAQTGEVTVSNVLGFLVTDRMLAMFGQKKKRAPAAAAGAEGGAR